MSSASKKYVKLDQREHVLKRPDMYIGSIRADTMSSLIINKEGDGVIKKEISFIPGLYKIFDEIVANAIDHSIRQEKTTKKVKNIKVEIDKKTGVISVYNDGEGIETVKHGDHDMYIPELLFGNLLTSSNYNDEEERDVIGTNGIGCKACNIMSSWFKVETYHSDTKKLYTQEFSENMSVVNKPTLVKQSDVPHTKIIFKPDYEKFGIKNITEDMYETMRKRVYDACAFVTKNTKVFFNDTELPYNGFKSYINLYTGDDVGYIYESPCDTWEFAIVASKSLDFTDGFEQVSFVNGSNTVNGGKHVIYVLDQIVKIIGDSFKEGKPTPQLIKDNIMIMVKCTVPNPTFNSQSKEVLTTPAKSFGCKFELAKSKTFTTKLLKSEIYENIKNAAMAKFDKNLKKTDGKKNKTIRGLPKLDDAAWAGTAKSKECTLILTEGDSAASMALSGLSSSDRDRYGVFPLKGKVMNVQDVTTKKIAENAEIANIKKILGLESGKTYTDFSDLRYGKIMLMTDSDDDGHHIKGLIFNMFHTLWPSLITDKKSQFLTSMLTPVIKARKKDEVKEFYNVATYEKWVKDQKDSHLWKIKYYKGLGTSTNAEAKEYFKNMNMVTYDFTGCKKSIDLAFNKKNADDRKVWLSKYDRDLVLDYDESKLIKCEDFINKELIHFSKYDLERSIPSLCDGLKISQRKILYACFKRNLYKDEIRVAQLAGYVSEHAAYHHGEASLQAAIVNMAQTYVGSNNLNLLMPNGQFGSRVHGGKDAGQPRYIHTQLSPIVEKLFIKADNVILQYVKDDGLPVEPVYYLPIIPVALINGVCGIGTGFSTTIPSYNPIDIIKYYINKLTNIKTTKLPEPFYNGFNGKIQKSGTKYISYGVWERKNDTTVFISELPVGTWTHDYKEDLEELIEKVPGFKNYENKSAENIHITLHFASKDVLDKLLSDKEAFEKTFKLVSYKGLSISNMYLFNEKGQITKYKNVSEILNAFYTIRLNGYDERKKVIVKNMTDDNELLKNKLRFIQEVIGKVIKVYEISKSELEDMLEKRDYLKKDGVYDYLTKIPIYNFTKDKVDELKKELKEMEKALEEYSNSTIESLWLNELKELEKHLV
jgi:DNA topoisomerase-2